VKSPATKKTTTTAAKRPKVLKGKQPLGATKAPPAKGGGTTTGGGGTAAGKKPKVLKAKKPAKSYPKYTNAQWKKLYSTWARQEQVYAREEQLLARRNELKAKQDLVKAARERKLGYPAAARRYQADARRASARARRETAKARKDVLKAKQYLAKSRRTSLALLGAVPDEWVLGGNDPYGNCAAVAVANNLLLTCGLRVDDLDVLELYLHTTDDTDVTVSVLDTLRTASDVGLGGLVLSGFSELEDEEPLEEDGLILELLLQESQREQDVWDVSPSPTWGLHAGVLLGSSVITWGDEVPVTQNFVGCQVLSAWRVKWD
jgi:hypothetical protein